MFAKSKLMALGLLVAVGVAGFASGAATASWAGEKRVGKNDRSRCSYSGMLTRELGLTEAQNDSIRAILRRHRPQMRAAFDQVRPQMDSIRAQIRSEIATVLSAAQMVAYDSMAQRQRSRLDSGRGSGVRTR